MEALHNEIHTAIWDSGAHKVKNLMEQAIAANMGAQVT